MPATITKQAEINASVRAVERELSPKVRYIRYSVGQDWKGEWALFFRAVLADEVSTGTPLSDITSQVIWRMTGRLNLPELGLFPHFDFRSESEQAELKEPDWEAAS